MGDLRRVTNNLRDLMLIKTLYKESNNTIKWLSFNKAIFIGVLEDNLSNTGDKFRLCDTSAQVGDKRLKCQRSQF
jgi:hypothetical protein